MLTLEFSQLGPRLVQEVRQYGHLLAQALATVAVLCRGVLRLQSAGSLRVQRLPRIGQLGLIEPDLSPQLLGLVGQPGDAPFQVRDHLTQGRELRLLRGPGELQFAGSGPPEFHPQALQGAPDPLQVPLDDGAPGLRLLGLPPVLPCLLLGGQHPEHVRLHRLHRTQVRGLELLARGRRQTLPYLHLHQKEQLPQLLRGRNLRRTSHPGQLRTAEAGTEFLADPALGQAQGRQALQHLPQHEGEDLPLRGGRLGHLPEPPADSLAGAVRGVSPALEYPRHTAPPLAPELTIPSAPDLHR